MHQIKIKTPHAAVVVWNYKDRAGLEGVSDLNDINQTIISTLSLMSIETSKSKSQPDGQFKLILAPYKNWVSTITAGSWCCIMMSNEPIKEKDFTSANPNLVKMVGRIDSVRVETQQVEDTRQTRYYVSGTDWGYLFNNIVYIDNLIAEQNSPRNQGNSISVAIRNFLLSKDGIPQTFRVDDNLRSLVNIFGSTLGPLTKAGQDINRLAYSIYDFNIPTEMSKFFDFRDSSGQRTTQLTKTLNLVSGHLSSYNEYEPSNEAIGFVNPFSLQGQHSFWQILLENSNPAMNEMFSEIRWNDGFASLSLYNRIKPFAYKDFKPSAGNANRIRSYFQDIKTHNIDAVSVMSVNAGSNWRDNYNFIEIRPDYSDFKIFENWYAQKTQTYDQKLFERDGFRPLIVNTKQLPVKSESASDPGNIYKADFDQLSAWVQNMKEWYFNTHRMLNGTLTMQGTTEYIGVGDNIKFDAGLINPNTNINSATVKASKNQYILAHVENISHRFTVTEDGARTYSTTIQFVRGIVVNGNKKLFGKGVLDQFTDSMSDTEERNTLNTVSTSTENDPDKKVFGK